MLKMVKEIVSLTKKNIERFESRDVPNDKKDDIVFISLDNHESFQLHSGEIISNKGLKFNENDYEWSDKASKDNPDGSKELGEADFDNFDNKCPKCGFEWDNK